MKIHEYQGKEIFRRFGVPVPRGVPAFNVDKEKSLASMERIAGILARENAQLWIHHDKPQSDAQKKSPAYYD